MFSWLTGRRRVYKDEFDVIDGDSFNWRRGGWGADGQQADGAVRYRLAGYDSPELGRAKSEGEWWWGQEAKAFLKWNIDQARKLQLKEIGRTTPHGDPVAILYIDGRDAKGVMIDAGLGKLPAGWSGAHMVRPSWDEAND